MTFLDSSVIIDYLDDDTFAVDYVNDETTAPYFTSVICVYEVLMGPVKSDETTSLQDERDTFGWIRSLPLNETIALEAARLQDHLTDRGDQMPARDVIIAATARSTGDKLVVADTDFHADRLRQFVDVVQLAD